MTSLSPSKPCSNCGATQGVGMLKCTNCGTLGCTVCVGAANNTTSMCKVCKKMSKTVKV